MEEQVFKAGDFCGPYQIVKLLGCGGFAEVYLALDEGTGAHVAIKCLRMCHLRNARTIKRLAAEAEVLGELDHPNIVQVEDAGVSKGVLWLAMEYLSGHTLRQVIRNVRGPLSPGLALYYASRIADGVGAAHLLNVVHRDLKPENVMVTKQDEVKVLDLGSAKFFDRDLTLSTGSSVVGTPLYMSPEQIKGEVVDARTDVYALGMILYELLAGRHALTVLSGRLPPAFEVGTLQLHARPRALHEVVNGLPEFLWPVVSKAIEKDAEDRYATMAEFAQAIREAGTKLSDDPAAANLWALGEGAEEIAGEKEAEAALPDMPGGEAQATVRADVKPFEEWADAANDGVASADGAGAKEGEEAAGVVGGEPPRRRPGALPPWMCEEQAANLPLEAGPFRSCVRPVYALKQAPPAPSNAQVIHLWSRRAERQAVQRDAEIGAAAQVSPMASSVEMAPHVPCSDAGACEPASGATERMCPAEVCATPETLGPTVEVEWPPAVCAPRADAGDVELSAERPAKRSDNRPRRRTQRAAHLRLTVVVGAPLIALALMWGLRLGEPGEPPAAKLAVAHEDEQRAAAPAVISEVPAQKRDEPKSEALRAEDGVQSVPAKHSEEPKMALRSQPKEQAAHVSSPPKTSDRCVGKLLILPAFAECGSAEANATMLTNSKPKSAFK